MPRLIAVQAGSPTALLAQLDRVWSAGDAALPLASDLPDETLEVLLARIRPAELRAGDDVRTWPAAPPVPDGTAVVVATSGSTGTPKAVVLSHAALSASVDASRARIGAADGVPWLGFLPLHHCAGLSVVLRSRAAGVEPSLHPRDTPELLAAAPPSWMSLVPAQLRRLLDAGVDLARHAGVLVGGAAPPPALLDRARATGATVVETYGLTESCGGVVYDGTPLAGVEVRADEDGHLLLRTPTAATGLRQPSGAITPVADADGWLRTEDLGTVVDGRVTVLGRADDVAISGGVNVPLGPVRRAVRGALGLEDATVVALPDERWGQAVTAVVTRRAAVPLSTLRAQLADVLPAPDRPTRMVVCDQLPTTELGKVTTATVVTALADGAAEEQR